MIGITRSNPFSLNHSSTSGTLEALNQFQVIIILIIFLCSPQTHSVPFSPSFRIGSYLFRPKRLLPRSHRWHLSFRSYRGSRIQRECYITIRAWKDLPLANRQHFRIYRILLLDWWPSNAHHWSRRCKFISISSTASVFFSLILFLDWRWGITYRPYRYYCSSKIFCPRHCPQWHIQQLANSC